MNATQSKRTHHLPGTRDPAGVRKHLQRHRTRLPTPCRARPCRALADCRHPRPCVRCGLGIVSCAATVARRSERDSSNFCARKAFPSAVTALTWTEPDSRPTGNRQRRSRTKPAPPSTQASSSRPPGTSLARKARPETRASSATGCLRTARPGLRRAPPHLVPSLRSPRGLPRQCCVGFRSVAGPATCFRLLLRAALDPNRKSGEARFSHGALLVVGAGVRFVDGGPRLARYAETGLLVHAVAARRAGASTQTRGLRGTKRRFRVSSDRSVRPPAIAALARMPCGSPAACCYRPLRPVGRRMAD